VAIEVVIPMLGVTVENGQIVEWLKNEGDVVEKGESLFIVEAEKVTTEVESPGAGILAKILLPAGEEVPVLTVVAIITEKGEAVPERYLQPALTDASGAATASVLSQDALMARPEAVPAGIEPLVGPVKIVPAARKLAQERHLDLQAITATGPEHVITHEDVVRAVAKAETVTRTRVSSLAQRKAEAENVSLEGIEGTGVRGRIMRSDVDAAVAQGISKDAGGRSAAAVDSAFGVVIPLDNMRQTIARRLSASAFTAPHVAFYTDVHMDPLLLYRKSILGAFDKKYALRPSINDFLIKAVALTIRDFPMLNATLEGNEIHILPNINVGLAVAIPNGLVVPAITDADQCGLSEIVTQRSDLVPRALKGQLTMNEMERGTFTISSLAQYDITFFTSILNPPQSGILSVGKTREELALVDGEVTVKHVATMGLAVDHRIIDGAMAAGFVQTLKEKLETPGFTFMHA